MSGAESIAGTQVADSIGWIDAGFVNCYTFRDGRETYLIDTGFRRRAQPVARAFREARVPLSTVGRVLLTHHHMDHMGGAAYLVEETHVPVSCHVDDAAFVDGQAKSPMPVWMRLFVRVHPAPVAVALKDGDRVGPLQVVHVPGHTPGEVAFYLPERRVLFSGDSVVEHKGRLTLAAPRIASNIDEAVHSLSRLRELDVELLLPGHGVPVTKDVDSLLDDLIQRAPAVFLGRPAT